ncbi:GNAT family N-acetyltransferase [Aquibaculum sediminis]|uniref:GNAT family N-acetyltransferase n=1 Tax=Aquibaculum sediminis TaxID=3231907 RepID=UPI003452C243
MPDGADQHPLQVIERLSQVSASEWDACAGVRCPFVSHAFLSALEETDCATAETGWLPQHLLARDSTGRLVGAVPLYLKSHSFGEYVFDWGWADAYERAGGRYYPKLQACVPFTPVTGPRLLVHPEADQSQVRGLLIAGLEEVARRHGVTSLHVTFPEEEEWHALGEAGFLQRIGRQFHWHNDNYAGFDDFLAALVSRKRKAIRKERAKVAELDLTFRALTGPEIQERHWAAFHRFYLDTADRKWGQPYLTLPFFQTLGERLAERVVLIVAERGDELLAGALNLVGDGVLYGRNWGCSETYRFLHFETCYYQAIDYAIAHGLRRVEAGAQGEHKVQRGYLATETRSAHLIRDPALERAVADYLRRESRQVRQEIELINRHHSPYRGLAE